MSESLFLIRILHMGLSSLVVFFAISLIMEGIFFAFRVKSPRLRAVCRSLLLLKLPIDVLLYQIFQKGMFVNLNPFNCQLYFEKMIVQWLPEHLKTNVATGVAAEHQLLLSDVLSAFVPLGLQIGLLTCLLVYLFGAIGLKIARYWMASRELKRLRDSADPYSGIIVNKKLEQLLHKSKAALLLSPLVSTPFACTPFASKGRSILFPSSLVKELKQDEFEAVIAHELEHVRWRDPLMRFIHALISSLFFWIPMKWWIKKLDADQEHACDLSVHLYGLDHHALANAVVKVASKKSRLQLGIAALCRLVSEKSASLIRLKAILQDQIPLQKRSKLLIGSVLASCALIVFWIC